MPDALWVRRASPPTLARGTVGVNPIEQEHAKLGNKHWQMPD